MSARLKVTHSVTVPDELKLARYHRAPELGPRVLFFSGGTALNPLSRHLADYTHNSIHIVTPFDSGGSSRVLRDAFDMPSVGDLRSRLMALADHTVQGHPEIYSLFSHRLSKADGVDALRGQLAEMISGKHPLVAQITDPMRKIIRQHLRYFADAMPVEFDLRGASIGNLILVGGYLNNDRHLDPVIYMFSKLVEVRGTVRPVTGDSLHLIAELEDGSLVKGQRELTGKELPPLQKRVRRVFLSNDSETARAVVVDARQKVKELIDQAELICFPMGSFYSSVIANLLPPGVTEAIRRNQCPKIFLPNSGNDPEQFGISLTESVGILLDYLRQHRNADADTSELLNFVLINRDHDIYSPEVDIKGIEALGVEVIEYEIAGGDLPAFYHEEALAEVLLSLT